MIPDRFRKMISACFENFASRINQIKSRLEDPDPMVAMLANSYLETLASKSGNDILEKLLVEATGRTVKDVTQKHGADSADGELEAKPMKCGYSAHISDDTPASLLRHQQIPWLILGEASKDGLQMKYAVLVPYRAFDEERFQAFVKELPAEERSSFAGVLPASHAERYDTLLRLKNIWPQKKYIRSNPLSFKTLCSLKPGEYSIWINGDDSVSIPKEIRELASVSASASASAAVAIRDYFALRSASDYADMTIGRLKDLCRERGIRGYSGKTKEELIALLSVLTSS
jgi:hypothetical protein